MASALQNSGLCDAAPKSGMTSLLAYGAFLAAVALILAVMFGALVG